MSVIELKPGLIEEIQKYGAFDISACFNCGNCTAVCPLSNNASSFPRPLIRLAQVGAKEELLKSKELWLCYYCGECSETCPRQAEPGEFMAAARRYAIAHYDPTKVSTIFYKSKIFFISLLIILAALFTYVGNWINIARPFPEDYEIAGGWFYETIHWVGIGLGIFIGLIALIEIINIYRYTAKHDEYTMPEDYKTDTSKLSTGKKFSIAFNTFFSVLWNEVMLQKRFQDPDIKGKDVFENRRYPHLFIFWGFILLFAVTSFNFLVKDTLLGLKGVLWPWYYPTHIVGYVGGALLVIGSTVMIIGRLKKPNKYFKNTHFTDWAFIIYMWLAGVTGFLATIAVFMYQSNPSLTWPYWLVIAHVVVVAELLLLAPFTKFAHAIYRPFALWFYETKKRYHEEASKE